MAMASQPTSGRLRNDFFLPRQEQSNWCWAAISVALARYFHSQQRTQCGLVQSTIDPPGLDCCATPDNPACNVVEVISAVLQRIDVPRRAAPAQPQGTISYDEIKQDIADDRPVICLMSGLGGEHYLVIVGWFLREGMPWLRIDDPAVGLRKETSFADFFAFEGRTWEQTTRLA
jgi:hypothetical protein